MTKREEAKQAWAEADEVRSKLTKAEGELTILQMRVRELGNYHAFMRERANHLWSQAELEDKA